MQVKELIKKLKEYDENAYVEIQFTYNDSDEGECFEYMDKLKFTQTENKEHKFLKITEDE